MVPKCLGKNRETNHSELVKIRKKKKTLRRVFETWKKLVIQTSIRNNHLKMVRKIRE